MSNKSKIYPVITHEGEVIGHGRIIDDRRVRLYNTVLLTEKKVKPVTAPHEMVLLIAVAYDDTPIGEVPLVNGRYLLANSYTVESCMAPPKVEPTKYVGPFDPFYLPDNNK